ncbi:salicylate carboxymethyltransferase-like isoform X1 [Primulina eburnea]|uniref:salicylate carboxymethyltransferase-like isoform X1 n=1 Tax=Primulina eburnea TaxID=1245227 RepID=UPI003C6BF81B
MEVKQVLHMNGGLGDTSYANNSLLQRKVISMTKPITEEAITELYISMNAPKNLCMAELGCSSGPNTMVVATELVKMVLKLCRTLGQQPPEFQIHLNDLNGNDFNSIFQVHLPMFQLELQDHETSRGRVSPCFVSAVPGSFYGRLFPSRTLHFIHSSYSLMWLSKIPKEVELLNKDNIYMASASPRQVIDAYYNQFRTDFSTFLRCRSEEVVSGGRMVLTILGRKSEDACSKDCCYLWELLALALKQMVAEGVIEEEKLQSFNIPQYTPSPTEVRKEVEKEGSFSIDHLETLEIPWAACGKGHYPAGAEDRYYDVGSCMRSVVEPLLVQHFGASTMDPLFDKYSKILCHRMANGEEAKFVSVTVSMTRI